MLVGGLPAHRPGTQPQHYIRKLLGQVLRPTAGLTSRTQVDTTLSRGPTLLRPNNRTVQLVPVSLDCAGV